MSHYKYKLDTSEPLEFCEGRGCIAFGRRYRPDPRSVSHCWCRKCLPAGWELADKAMVTPPAKLDLSAKGHWRQRVKPWNKGSRRAVPNG